MHAIHCVTVSLAAAEQRDVYRRLADAVNAVRFPGTQLIPPMEERLTSNMCDDLMCRCAYICLLISTPVVVLVRAFVVEATVVATRILCTLQ